MKKVIVYIIIIAAFVSGYFVYRNYYKAQIEINLESVVTVKNKNIAEKVIADIKSDYEKEYGKNIVFLESVEIISGGNKITDERNAKKIVKSIITPGVESVAIVANGTAVCGLPDREEAGRLLSMAKDRFNPLDGNVIEEPEIKEKILIEQTLVNPDICFKTAKEAFGALFENKTNIKRADFYIVKKGDTASHIAMRYKMKISELSQLNPSVNINKIKPKDKILINKSKQIRVPFTVIVRKEITTIEKVPYKITKVSSAALYGGKTKVLFPGKAGKKKTKYSVVFENGKKVSNDIISEEYIVVPINKQVAVGIKAYIP